MARKISILQRLPLAPVIGAMFGAAAAVLVAATPAWIFEQTVGSPVSLTIRLLAIFVAFVMVGFVVWGLVRIAERLFAAPVAREDELDLATFAEALPIPNGVRRPISAGELGAPLMSDEALKTIPPLVLEEPEPVIAEARVEVEAPVAEDASIEALIARLEAGLARYGKPQPPHPTGPAALPPSPKTGSSWIVRDEDIGGVEPPTMLKRVLAG
ncbi:MAG: hypothetical protein ABI898_12030 [Sphingomonadales bacterium]